MDSKSIDTDMENATPETKYFKMMMEDNEIGRVADSDNADDDSIIGGQTIASLMNNGNIAAGVIDSSIVESYSQSNDTNQSTISIVGYDDVSTIANDTVNETTKAFFTGNGDREDSKPRIRLFKEYKNEYKTPEKKKKSSNPFDDDDATQPETPPGMIQVPSSHNRSSSSYQNNEEFPADGKDKSFFLRARRVYIVAGVLALILFVSIIALAVTLNGVRGKGSSGNSSSSSSENNGKAILDIWPDLDTSISNNEKPEDLILAPTGLAPSPETVLAPSPEPGLAPSPEPTVDRTTQINFDEILNLLIDRDVLYSEKEFESNSNSHQYNAMIWLSQDPNYSDYTQDRHIQRWSLAVLAQSLDPTMVVENQLKLRKLQGDLLPGWMTYTDECTWFSSGSITASPCDQNGMYQTIDLQDMMLGGNLPTELALLSNSLQHIILDGNGLTGSIPEELENLTNLVTLRLRQNSLEKELRIDFGQLVSLEILDVGRNLLTGDIPYEILELNSLTDIYLDYNKFSGYIPWDIGALNSLSVLALGDNSLTGWVPDSLAELQNLKILTLGNNDLTGTLPNGVCLFGGLEVLSVDCVEQGCECCTECSTTDSPSSDPSMKPTRSPTVSPTAVRIPSSSPTECFSEISVLDFCFAPSANIGITLSNCNSERDDWVGIYRVDETFDYNSLANPELWTWSCGTRNCKEAVTQKTIPINNIHGENDKWPLEPGMYVAVMARNTAQPYTSYATSDTFVVATQC